MSTSVAGMQSVTNPNMNWTAGTGNGTMTMFPPNSTFQPVGHKSIPFGLPSPNPTITLSQPGSAFQAVAHQSIPLRPAAINPTMTSLALASAFIPVVKQSIHLTLGSVNQPMTMSAPPRSLETVQNDSIGVSANVAIPMSPVPPSHLHVVPNEAITVAASGSAFQPVDFATCRGKPSHDVFTTGHAFLPVGQQSINLTPGSVNEGITLSAKATGFQPVGSLCILL